MSVLEIMIAIAGATVTAMVVIGMILLTPSGVEPVHDEEPETAGADPGSRRTPAREPAPGVARTAG